jgi:hypothetical protein
MMSGEVRDVGLQIFGEPGQDLRRELRRHVSQDEGDRLRVLILDEGEQLARIGLL